MSRSTLPSKHDLQPVRPSGLTIGNKWFGRYEGVPCRALLVHFPDRQTRDPTAYSCVTSGDPYTLTHYAAHSHAVLFASSFLDWQRVLNTFPGGVSVLMKRPPLERMTWRNMLLDEAVYEPVPASITHPIPELAYTIGRHLNRLRYPLISN